MEQKILGNRYKIIGKIAEGGMATLYTAEDTVLSRIVAIKILKEEYAQDEEFLQKFKNEALAVAKLNHPNIISIFDVGQEEHTPYIVMEYVEGENLKEIIRRNGKFSQKETLQIGRQIAASLDEAHKKRIIHRDIKSANIMLTGRNMVKVGDFGIAKVVSSATITAVGSIMGSVHYFSPEQARGGFVDERTDLYSLGIVLYEMATGRLPYKGDSPVNVALQHIQNDMKFLEGDEVSEGLQRLILKLTQKNPDDRYDSAEAVMQDMTYLLNDDMEHFQTVGLSQNVSTKKMTPPVLQREDNNRAAPRRSSQNKRELRRVPAKKKKNYGGIFITIFLLLLLLGSAGALWASGMFDFLLGNSREETFQMINITGLTVEDAQKKVDELQKSLSIEVVSSEENARYAPGEITNQDPRAGIKIHPGTVIKVIISGQKMTVQVPRTKGMTPEEAKNYLTEKGLNYEIKEMANPDVNYQGKVFDQLPAPDAEIEIGGTVTLFVGKAGEAELKEVPVVVGYSLETAKQKILDGGFQYAISYREERTRKEGEVLEQNPTGGSNQLAGTKILIVVNEYKEATVSVPPPSENGGKPIGGTIKKTQNIDISNYHGEITIAIKDTSTEETVYFNTVTVGDYPNGIIKVEVDGTRGTTKRFDVYVNGTKLTSFNIQY